MIRSIRHSAAATVVAAVVVLGVPPAALAAVVQDAPEQPTLRVEHVELGSDGSSELTVSVAGLPHGTVLDEADVRVVENGVTVTDLTVGGVTGESSGVRPAVVVAMDISGSTEGEPLLAAITAAQTLVTDLETAGVVTGLVEFGPEVAVLTRLDEPAGSVAASLDGLEAAGATALYDGVARAIRLLVDHDGPRDLVVFSDGVDTVSRSDLDTVRRLAADAEVRVTTVALDTGEMDLAPLLAIAEATGGQLIRVTDPAELLSAFQGVAADLTSRFVLSWDAEPAVVPPSQLSLEVAIATPGGEMSHQLVALNPRVPAITPPVPYEPVGAPVPLLANRLGLVTGAAAAFLAVLVMAGLVLSGAGERRRREQLAARLEGWDGLGDAPDEAVVAAASLSERAVAAVDRLPRPRGMEERLSNLLERADWPMRPSEFQLLTLATMLGGLVVPLVLTRSVPLALLGLMAGTAGPHLTLKIAVGRRAAAFEDQLPSVLSLLAGALRAGHGFATALDGTIREIDEPAHSELRRAAVEQRLGRPVAEALRGVSERMRSDDLRMVVTAITIQQDVGGNLAELLDNVASTLRDRASLGRTVKALAAEGRMSAWVIGAMPFIMFIALSVINPSYMAVLVETVAGRAMLAVGFVLLLMGSAWLRKIVQPKY